VAAEIRAKGRRCVALGLDVRSGASIRACLGEIAREWGTIDILVNNAGTNIPTDLVSLAEEGWDTVRRHGPQGCRVRDPGGASAYP
jgi:NADP-dependent 3-hydroxy acid dehydrogenase YdfG